MSNILTHTFPNGVVEQFIPIKNNAGAHNALYRGDDLTEYFNSGEMSAAIVNGSFKDIFPGDYIKKSITVDGTEYKDVKWIIGDCDYHLNRGDTQTTKHHVLVFPEGVLGAARMNETNTTEGGYVGSEMWTVTIPNYVTGIQTAFGSDHVLSHRELLTKSVNTTAPSGAGCGWNGSADNWQWTSVLVNLFNEPMVYGGRVFSSSGMDVYDCNTQVAAMRHNKGLSFSRSGWSWLRAVVSGAHFAYADSSGIANNYSASGAAGRVRPYFLLT